VLYTENALNILTIESFKGIGKAKINSNLKGNEDITEIIDFLNKFSKENISIFEFENRKENFRKILEKLENSCDGLLAIGDEDFPYIRGNVPDSEKPIYIFYKGDIELLQDYNKNISVIGLLNPTEEIIEREKKIVKKIISENITIVSGLAFGCDSVAHIQALEGGKTIAILPSPLSNILPKSNQQLAYEIVESGGLLISEYYDDVQNYYKLSQRYKERDRLQALFCDAIILIASYAQNSSNIWKDLQGEKLDSGARLAMGDARKYNILRAVMYNQELDLDNPMFDLNRELLQNDDVVILTNKNLNFIINSIKKENTKKVKVIQKNLL